MSAADAFPALRLAVAFPAPVGLAGPYGGGPHAPGGLLDLAEQRLLPQGLREVRALHELVGLIALALLLLEGLQKRVDDVRVHLTPRRLLLLHAGGS